MAKEPFRLDGGRQLLDNLADLPKATGTNVKKRVLKAAIEPVAARVRATSPTRFGDLVESETVGKKLTRRQASQNKKGRAEEQLHFGTSDPAGMMNEFGLGHTPAQPFFRSAWESLKRRCLEIISTQLGQEIMKAVARYEKKLSRRR